MLSPDDRSHLFQLLRPPSGYGLDFAIGTTYSLDLFALLTLPIAFASMDLETTEGDPTSNPVVLLEAVRRYADRMTIFSQAGRIAMPRKHQLLFAYLENSITEVQAPNPKGIFHPKVWVLRFIAGKEVLYRLLCLSRNLTFDRSWDTVVSLEGQLVDRQLAISKNHPLGNFVASLPDMAIWRMPIERSKRVAQISEELRRVKFEPPPGFEDFEFWAGGVDESPTDPFSYRVDKGLIISPFLPTDFGGADGLKSSVCDPFLTKGISTVLVSRHESLREVNSLTLQRFSHVLFMDPDLPTGDSQAIENQADSNEALDGLHAKVYVADRGKKASVFSGSFNATHAAFHFNVEFMIEMIGSKNLWGVDRFLYGDKQSSGFRSLLKQYNASEVHATIDATGRLLDQMFENIRHLIVQARLIVDVNQEGETFQAVVTIHSEDILSDELEKLDSVHFWPISLQEDRALVLDPAFGMIFKNLSFEALTPLVAFKLRASLDGVTRESCFVLNLPMRGAPLNRLERVLASIINDKEKLFRLIWLILASGEEGELSANFSKLMEMVEGNAAYGFFTSGLFEMLLDAVGKEGHQFRHVVSLIEGIQKSPSSSNLLEGDFFHIWEPIVEAARDLERR